MDEINKMIENAMKAKEEIISFTKGKRNTSGRIDPCPVCKEGPLAFSVHHNGHVHAICETGCVNFME